MGMSEDPYQSQYVFLDDEPDRKQFLATVHDVRQRVREIVHHVPESQWYAPRYHGWTLAAMLSHLNLTDNVGMLAIKAALLGICPSVSEHMRDRFNQWTATLFRKRLVPSSLRSMDRNEQNLAKFVLPLPVDKFSRSVYVPPVGIYTTIERAIQIFFLFHWQEHLKLMREIEGIQPSQRSDNG